MSDQERAAQLESTIREVAQLVSEKCVNSKTQRPYTVTQIRDAMKSAGYMVHPTRNIKQQFLDCVKLLQKKKMLDIERAKMELCLVLLALDEEDYEQRRKVAVELLIEQGVKMSDIKQATEESRILFQSDPSLYRRIMEAIAGDELVKGRLDIIQQCVIESGDVTLCSELKRRAHQQSGGNEGVINKAAEIETKGDLQQLSKKLQSKLAVDNEDDYCPTPMTNSRKAQKAATKKSKKAKRREKEETIERQERITAEKERQKKRAERLSLTEEEPTNKLSSGQGYTSTTAPGKVFATRKDLQSHFRSDWHRYNLKLKMKGVAPVSEQEFLLVDADAFF